MNINLAEFENVETIEQVVSRINREIKQKIMKLMKEERMSYQQAKSYILTIAGKKTKA